MFELLFKIWYFIILMPIIIAKEGYEMLKKFMAKHGYKLDRLYVWLFALIILLILVVLFQYGYR